MKDIIPLQKFWFVWLEGKPGPTYKHLTKTKAIAEAGRLFNTERRRAYVLEVVGYHDIVASAYRGCRGDEVLAPEAPEAIGGPEEPSATAVEESLTEIEKAYLRDWYGHDSHISLISAIKSIRTRMPYCTLHTAVKACRAFHLHRKQEGGK